MIIIPRGWERNRRPRPYDRRTPLIIPGESKPPYEPPATYRGAWTPGNYVKAGAYDKEPWYTSIVATFDPDWWAETCGPYMQVSSWDGSSWRYGVEWSSAWNDEKGTYAGMVLFSNNPNPTQLDVYGAPPVTFPTYYSYNDLWPAFFDRQGRPKNAAGSVVTYDPEKYIYWSERPIRTANVRFARCSLEVANTRTTLVTRVNRRNQTNMRPSYLWAPLPIADQDNVYCWMYDYNWVSGGLRPIYEAYRRRGASIKYYAFVLARNLSGTKQWRIDYCIPVVADYTIQWQQSLPQGIQTLFTRPAPY